MCIGIVEVFDNTFGPLETLLAEVASAVQGHDGCQIFKLFSLFVTYLKHKKFFKEILIFAKNIYMF